MWGILLSLLSWLHLSPVPFMAYLIGTTEPALKLLISILMGYPLAVFYHKYVRKEYNEHKNKYFILTGLDMAFYNFGLSMYHNMIPAVVMYITTKVLGPGKNNVIVTFVFNMAYLLVGYIVTESEDYDITWTMPHCVLTLKLIALSFDLWDGQKLAEGHKLSVNAKKTALKEAPSFAELIGFIYFPACFLVGPIFSFRRYSDYLQDKFPLDKEEGYNKRAMARLVLGVAYLIAFQVGVSIFSIKEMTDPTWDASIFYRHLYCGLWAHFALYKYISCWLLTEASCTRFGLSYNGPTINYNGELVSKWDGCSNIKLLQFEFATKFQHYIESFNCNTNHFAAEYIYKRLKFLGDRNLSQGFTLLFLALWHGTRSGYYMTFFNEFMIMYMEKEFESIISKTSIYKTLWDNTVTSCIMYCILKLYTIVFMGWSLVPFDIKVFSKWWSIYYSLYFSGFLFFLPWAFAYKPLLLYVKDKL